MNLPNIDPKLWSAFAQTGRVEDYLRYCGVDIYAAGQNTAPPPEERRHDHRRPDPQGVQQHR